MESKRAFFVAHIDFMIYDLGCPPSQDAIVANEGLGWGSPILYDPMVHNPGGDDCILGGGTTQFMYIYTKKTGPIIFQTHLYI